jgi:hypothetical protein
MYKALTGNKIVCMWCAICREVDISFLGITVKPLYVDLLFINIYGLTSFYLRAIL